MGRNISVLNEKYKVISKSIKNLDEKKQELESLVQQVCEALDDIDKFEDEDLDELREILPSVAHAKFDSIRKYFKVLNRFPNQSQILKARKVLEDIKKDFIEYIKKDRRVFYNIYTETQTKYNVLKFMIGQLSSYDGTQYFDTTILSSVLDILNKSEINDELISFYEEVLINNLKFDDEVESSKVKQAHSFLDKFVYRLTRINKSLTNDSLNNDKMLYDFFCKLLDESDTLQLSAKEIENLTNLIKKNVNSDSAFNKLQFLIHLKKVQIPYDKKQQKFLNEIVKDFYERINDIKDKQRYEANIAFIEGVTSNQVFVDIDLLNKVFELNNVEIDEKIKIICWILIINQSKKNELSNIKKTS